MPLLSIDELKRAVVTGRLGAITIDTSVYESYKFGFEVGHLAQMAQFTRIDVDHLLVDMVKHEILSHLESLAKDDKAHVKNALKPLLNSWGISTDIRNTVMATLFGDGNQDEMERSIKRLDAYEAATGATVIKCADFADLRRSVQMYFNATAPFSNKPGKKHEFPDAFTLLALEGWATKQNKLVLAVAKDGDWKSFCEESQHVCYLDDLPSALSAFHPGADLALEVLYKAIRDRTIADLETQVLEELNAQSYKIEISMEASSSFYYEDELNEVYISLSDTPLEHQLQELEVVDFQGNSLLVRAIIECTIEPHFSVSFEHWDGIDREYTSMGSSEFSGQEMESFEALLRFAFADGVTLLDEVELIGKRLTIEFGEIEPDWMSHPHEYED